MSPTEVPILFMDDEAHDSTAVVVHQAVQALRARGYEVTVVDRMSDAIDAFYSRFYRVFVLDIDMSRAADALSQGGERGTRVAEVYRALDNGAAVVLFSARGMAEDWFRVGNRHVFGYVHKGEQGAIDRLLALVEKASAADPRGLRLPSPRRSGSVLVCSLGASRFAEADLADRVRTAGAFTARFCALPEMADELAREDFTAALLVADRFETRPAVQASIDAVCARQPRPQVVVACEGAEANMASVLHLVNARPFRLINLLAADAGAALTAAVRDAAYWYGGNECFPAEPEYVRRAARKIDWRHLDEHFGANEEQGEEEGEAPRS
jgi:hypothetical protein